MIFQILTASSRKKSSHKILLTKKLDLHIMDFKGGDNMTCGVKGCGTAKPTAKKETKKAAPKKATKTKK
jgi:hypothetical protein